MVLALVALWELRSGHCKLVHVLLGLLWDGVVGADFLLDLSEVGVLVHGVLGDRNHGVNNVPKDTLDKWGGSQGSLIGESSVEVNELDKLLEVERALLWSSSPFQLHFSVLLLVNQSGQELVVVQNVLVLDLSHLEVFIRHDLEDESKNSCEELGGHLVVGTDLGWVNLLIDEMNNVHLKIHQLSID